MNTCISFICECWKELKVAKLWQLYCITRYNCFPWSRDHYYKLTVPSFGEKASLLAIVATEWNNPNDRMTDVDCEGNNVTTGSCLQPLHSIGWLMISLESNGTCGPIEVTVGQLNSIPTFCTLTPSARQGTRNESPVHSPLLADLFLQHHFSAVTPWSSPIPSRCYLSRRLNPAFCVYLLLTFCYQSTNTWFTRDCVSQSYVIYFV